MKHAWIRNTVICAAGAIALAPPASAQVSLGADLDFASGYVWRGRRLSDQFGLQPSLWVTLHNGPNNITFGAWSHVEVATAGATDLTLRQPSSAGVARVDYFMEWTRQIKLLEVGLGGTVYTFKGFPGARNNTTMELYTVLGLALPLAPSIKFQYDLDAVKGLYVEPAIDFVFDATSSLQVQVGARAGLSVGASPNASDPTEVAYYSGDGLGQVEFSLGTRYRMGPVAVGPIAHWILNIDDRTKITTADPTVLNDSQFWIGVSVGWVGFFEGR